MLSGNISKCVLTVGPDYKNHRGGIGGVIDLYSKRFETFKFVATYPAEKSDNIFSWVFVFIIGLLKLMGKLTFDRSIKIVHIHSAAKGSFLRKYCAFVVSKYIFRKKVIFHSHGSELKDFYASRTGIVRKIFNDFMNHVDVIICLSPQWHDFYTQHFKTRKVIVLENIIERPVDIAPAVPAAQGVISFLFLGLIGDRKGIFDLIEVIRDNMDVLKGKAKFVIGGNGETDKLLGLIRDYNLGDMVAFQGWVTGAQKIDLLKNCSVYLLPSYNEGLPLSVLEAMSYGKPVISTYVGGIPEVVKDDLNGFLINPGDRAHLFRSINTFLQHPERIPAMGLASLQIVEPYYAHNVMVKLEKIYIDLLSNK